MRTVIHYVLALHLLGLEHRDKDDMFAKVDLRMTDKYGFGIDDFDRLISELLPMIEMGNDPITGAVYKGFASKDANDTGSFLSCVPVDRIISVEKHA